MLFLLKIFNIDFIADDLFALLHPPLPWGMYICSLANHFTSFINSPPDPSSLAPASLFHISVSGFILFVSY